MCFVVDWIKLSFKRLLCQHKYKCVYLASKNDEKTIKKSNGTVERQPKRIVGEYTFECTSCGKRLNVHMDYWYQMAHDDIIN